TVLLVKDGGEYDVRQPPEMPASDNLIRNRYVIRHGDDVVPMEGTGEIAGQFAPSYRSQYESTEKRQFEFEGELSREFPGAEVTQLEFANVEGLEAPVAFDFEASVPAMLEPSGDEWLLYPHGNPATLAARLAFSNERTQDLVLPFAFVFENT